VRLLTALAIFAALLVFIVIVVAGFQLALATGRATGIAFTRASIAALMLLVLLLAVFSYWLSGRFVR